MDNTELMDKVVEWECKDRARLLHPFTWGTAKVYREIGAALTVAHFQGISLGLEMAAAVYHEAPCTRDTDQQAGSQAQEGLTVMALRANREVDHYVDQELRCYQVAGGAHIFKGALVGLVATGYARPLTAGDKFAGIAYEEMGNSAGSGAASVRVYTLGDFGLTLAGATVADIGRLVFASADDTLTFTGASNSYVGVVQDFVQTDEIILRLATLASPPR